MAEEPLTFTREDLRQELHHELQHYATREDIANVRTAVAEMKADLIKWIAGTVIVGMGVSASVAVALSQIIN